VDPEGWRYILQAHCGVDLWAEGDEVFEEEIPVRFVLYLVDGKKFVKSMKDDVVRFCGVHQRESPSGKYLRALKRARRLARRSNRKTRELTSTSWFKWAFRWSQLASSVVF